MITKDQFRLQMERLIDTFGDRFPAQRELMIWESVDDLEYSQVIRIVDSFIRKSKTAPLPADFGEAVALERKSTGSKTYALGELQPRETCRCLDCADSGFIRLERIAGHQAWAKFETGSAPCHCDRGALISRNQKYNLGPQFNDAWRSSYKILPAYESRVSTMSNK